MPSDIIASLVFFRLTKCWKEESCAVIKCSNWFVSVGKIWDLLFPLCISDLSVCHRENIAACFCENMSKDAGETMMGCFLPSNIQPSNLVDFLKELFTLYVYTIICLNPFTAPHIVKDSMSSLTVGYDKPRARFRLVRKNDGRAGGPYF